MNSSNNLLIKLVIFSVVKEKLKVFIPKGSLPSERLQSTKSLDKVACDIFTSVAGISLKDSYLEQLYTFSISKKKTEVAVVYYLLLPSYRIPTKSMKEWLDCKILSQDIPDSKIIKYAIQRLRWKIEYTNIVYSLLPREFIFSDLQTVYEAILARHLDKRNFRKKMLSLNILTQTGKMKKLGRARPAEIFSFKRRHLTFVEIL